MHYHQLDNPGRGFILPQAPLDRFQRFTIRLGQDHLPSLKFHSQWFPGKQKFSKKMAELVLPNRDNSQIYFDIELVRGNSLAQFVQMEASACPDVKTKNFRSSSLNMKVDSKRIVMSAKK